MWVADRPVPFLSFVPFEKTYAIAPDQLSSPVRDDRFLSAEEIRSTMFFFFGVGVGLTSGCFNIFL